MAVWGIKRVKPNEERGELAVADMKIRIKAMRDAGLSSEEMFDRLWERNKQATVFKQGYTYCQEAYDVVAKGDGK